MTHRRLTAPIAIATAALLAWGTPIAPAAADPHAETHAEPDAGPDAAALRRSLDAVHAAGMYGLYSAVRDGDRAWRGASGVADVETRRPVHPGMLHRVGSITKTFTAVAVLQQVERGAVELDAPVGDYLPDLMPGERGRKITVRMLLNHTSHISNYVGFAFPSLLENSATSLDDNRFRTRTRRELARLGLDAPATGEPGATPGSYSNTNYVLLGLLLEKVTGEDAERHITRNVIRRAGLRNTSFPTTPRIPGPHSKAYEAWYKIIDPPRDYSVFDMSWATTAGALMSTMDDLNRFYRALLRGRLIGPALLAEMRETVVVRAGLLPPRDYGLGIYSLDLPCGRFWGHTGSVFGMAAQSLSSPDGARQVSVGLNLTNHRAVEENGTLEPGPIEHALTDHLTLALCGTAPATATASRTPSVPAR